MRRAALAPPFHWRLKHLLTKWLFRAPFIYPDCARRNIIAAEFEKVIDALVSQSFSRADF